MKKTSPNQFHILPLLKSLGLLFAIVILFSLLSRYLYGNGQTLLQYPDSKDQKNDSELQDNGEEKDSSTESHSATENSLLSGTLPEENPLCTVYKEGGQIVLPEGSEAYTDRSAAFPYKIDTEDLCYRLFTEHGFTWGGNWNSMKDYQHFQKALE